MRTLAVLLAALVSIAPAQGATRRHIAGRGDESPFGVNIDVVARPDASQLGRALDLEQADGIQWVRIQFAWSIIQPTPGTANYGLYSQLVARANQDDLHILGTLGYATQWNTTAPPGETRPAQREHYPPADYDAWARYVFTTVQIYKGSVHYWEVWNQPDLGSTPDDTHPCNGYWCGSAAQFALLLSLAYTNIKAADPNAIVLLGGLALSGSELNTNFLFDILTDPDHPATQSFDVMNFHAYGSEAEALRRLNLVKSDLLFGGSGPRTIWITEFGYGSDPAVQTTAPYFNGETGQAAYVKALSVYLLNLGVKKVFWFQLLDGDPASTDTLKSYGLLGFSFTKKQAYDAYGQAIKAYSP